MAVLVAVASGKGGVGKSVLVSNLGILLSATGLRVVMADLDTGSADLATLFGEFHVKADLGDFMTRGLDGLEEALFPIPFAENLRLLAGSGDSLATANPAYSTKQRILRHIRTLDADVVLLDIGAGVGFNQLDFFLSGDVQVVVTTPDPTAVMDAYRFIKLAAIRKVVMQVTQDKAKRREISARDYASIAELRQSVEAKNFSAEDLERLDALAASFAPKLVLNRAAKGGRVNFASVRELLHRYTNAQLDVLGEIPQDELVERSVRGYLPVTKGFPTSPAALAMSKVAVQLKSFFPAAEQGNDEHIYWEDVVEELPVQSPVQSNVG